VSLRRVCLQGGCVFKDGVFKEGVSSKTLLQGRSSRKVCLQRGCVFKKGVSSKCMKEASPEAKIES